MFASSREDTTTAGKRPAPARRHPRLIRAYKLGWPRVAVHRMILWKLRGGPFAIRAQGPWRLRAARPSTKVRWRRRR